MMYRSAVIVITLALNLFASSTMAQFDGTSSGTFGSKTTQFLSIEQAYQVSPYLSDNQLSMLWTAAPSYYLYQHMFSAQIKQGGQTTPLKITFPDGKLKYDEIFNKELTVYYGSTDLLSDNLTLDQGDILSLTFQGCADAGLCYPPETWYFEYSGAESFYQIDAPTTSAQSDRVGSTSFSWWLILSALLGGLILNAMPCVFPVIALKATSFVNSGDQARPHAWAYTAGVLSSFLMFAAFIILLAQAGTTVGWGFHLQSPLTIAMLSYLFTAMAIVLALDLPIAHTLMGLGSEKQTGASKQASFFTGLLAVVVASPCTAPFMGVAMGAALTQSPLATVVIFLSLGMGLALPILVLSYWPALIKRLPKPGPWMVTVRELMVFPLMATSIYLVWVLGQQIGMTGATQVLLGALLVAMAIWSYGKATKLSKLSALVLTAVAIILANPDSTSKKETSLGWLEYTPATLEEAKQKGPVFVDVTAAWCITCIANRSAIESEAVSLYFKQNNITLIEADWTIPNDDISSYLKSFGRAGVPLYVYYPDNEQSPKVLPQLLTSDLILKNIQE